MADPCGQLFSVTRLTLPDGHDGPPEGTQGALGTAISRHVLFKLAHPESHIAFRSVGETAATMSVPEAAMDYDDCSVLRKNDVGAARQLPTLQPESETQPVKDGADDSLRCCVAAPDPRHVPAATLTRKVVGHRALSARRCLQSHSSPVFVLVSSRPRVRGVNALCRLDSATSDDISPNGTALRSQFVQGSEDDNALLLSGQQTGHRSGDFKNLEFLVG